MKQNQWYLSGTPMGVINEGRRNVLDVFKNDIILVIGNGNLTHQVIAEAISKAQLCKAVVAVSDLASLDLSLQRNAHKVIRLEIEYYE